VLPGLRFGRILRASTRLLPALGAWLPHGRIADVPLAVVNIILSYVSNGLGETGSVCYVTLWCATLHYRLSSSGISTEHSSLLF
jgi:hypothetical protein